MALGRDSEEVLLFEDAGGQEPTYQALERTLVSLERTLLFLNAEYDDFLRGNMEAIPPEAQDGWRLTNDKGRCAACHRLDASTPFGADVGGASARKKGSGSLGRRPSVEWTKDSTRALSLESELAELGRLLRIHNRVDTESQEFRRIRRIGLSTPQGQGDSLHPLWEVLDHSEKNGEEGTPPKGTPGPAQRGDQNTTHRP
jgi:hypothetical protein